MLKRAIASALGIFIAWTALDLLLHSVVLRSAYEANAHLWRSAEQISTPLVLFVTLVLIAGFVSIYALLVQPKSLKAGLQFGALIGIITGMASGFGTYIHMPIPLVLAWGWLVGGWIKAFVAGAILGILVRPKIKAEHAASGNPSPAPKD